jgi:hypothetical protein
VTRSPRSADHRRETALELHVPKPAAQRPKKIAIGSGSQKAIES